MEELKQAIEILQSSAQIPKSETEDAEKKPVEAEQEPTIPSVSTDFDILGLLGHIEQKTNDLLTLHLAVNAPKNRNQIVIGEDGIPKEVSALSAGNVGGLLGQGPSAPLSRLAILAPSTMYAINFRMTGKYLLIKLNI